MLLSQLSYAIKNQLKAPIAPYKGLEYEMSPTRSISFFLLVLYGIRMAFMHDRKYPRLLYITKNQRKAGNAPSRGLWVP